MSIALVQSAANPTISTAATAYGSNNTAGNCLIAVFRSVTPVGTVSITDTQGNVWTVILQPANGASKYGIAYAPNCKVGANTVTFSSATFYEYVIAEYSGLDTASPYDGHNTSAGPTTGTAYSVGPITPVNASNLVIAMVENETAGVTLSSVGGGFTNRANAFTNTYLLDLIQSSAAAATASATLSSSVAWAGAIASFKGATHTISGNAGVAGATVAWTGTSSGSVTADGSGNYTTSGLVDGSYTITPSKTGYTFAPVNSAQTVSGANITGVNFVATNTPVATPTFSPVAGSYGPTQNVTISSTDSGLAGFAITYTTDGSTPVPGSHGTVYTTPVAVASSLTLKAVASATSYANSNVGSAAYVITGGSVAYSVPDCRATKPNSATFETVNGTKIYDVQTSSNPAIPPTDSRVNKPVDSRVSPNIPQNSRTPGTFGPGE